MAWLPQVRAQRLLRDVYAQATNPKSGKRFAFDILDRRRGAPRRPVEPVGGRPADAGYAVDTQRTVAVRQLADKCEHRLFLSATPHNGHPESFTALMEMIDSAPVLPRRAAGLEGAEGRHGPPAQDATCRQGVQEPRGQALCRSRHDDDEQEMFSLLDDIVTESAKHERHQARRRHRDDAVEEAVPVQPVRVRHDAQPLPRSSKAGRGLSRRRLRRHLRRGPVRRGRRPVGAGRGRAAARVQGLRPAQSPPSPASSRQLDGVGAELREPPRLPARRADHASSTRCAAPTASTGPTSGSWSSPSTPTPSTGCSAS